VARPPPVGPSPRLPPVTSRPKKTGRQRGSWAIGASRSPINRAQTHGRFTRRGAWIYRQHYAVRPPCLPLLPLITTFFQHHNRRSKKVVIVDARTHPLVSLTRSAGADVLVVLPAGRLRIKVLMLDGCRHPRGGAPHCGAACGPSADSPWPTGRPTWLPPMGVPHGMVMRWPHSKAASPHARAARQRPARRHVRSSGCGSGWSGHPGRWPRPCPRLPLTSLLTASHAATGDVQLCPVMGLAVTITARPAPKPRNPCDLCGFLVVALKRQGKERENPLSYIETPLLTSSRWLRRFDD